MAAFPLAALFGYFAWGWHNQQKSHLFWISSAIAFAFAIDRDPSPIFAALFAFPTVFLIVRSMRQRTGLRHLAYFAVSDLLIVIALSVRYAASSSWSLPQTWTAGATLIAAAGVARLIGAVRGDGVEGSLHMWQGLFLIHWVSDAAAPALILSCVGFLALATLGSAEKTAPAFGLGVALIMASSGPPAVALVAVGLGVLAFSLGERALSAWVILAAPLSAATHISAPRYHFWVGPVAAAVVACWGYAASRMARQPGGSAGRVPAISGFVVTTALFWSVDPELLIWMIYAALVTAAAVFVAFKPSPAVPYSVPQLSFSHEPGWLNAAAWIAMGAAFVFEVRLLLIGVSTGFL